MPIKIDSSMYLNDPGLCYSHDPSSPVNWDSSTSSYLNDSGLVRYLKRMKGSPDASTVNVDSSTDFLSIEGLMYLTYSKNISLKK